MDTIESLSTQFHDMDKSNEEDKQTVYDEIKKLGSSVGGLQTSVDLMMKEFLQLKRIMKDMGFDINKAVHEVNKSVNEVNKAIGGDKT